MTEYPKTYLVKGIMLDLLQRSVARFHIKYALLIIGIVFISSVAWIPLLSNFVSDKAVIVVLLAEFIFALLLLLVITSSKVTFKLYADRLEYSNWGVGGRILLSEVAILFDRKTSKAFLLRRNTIWMPFIFLPDELLSDLFMLLTSVPVFLIEVGSITMGTYRPPKEDAFSNARLAAIAFAYLEDPNISKALVARQALINVSGQEPGYTPNNASSDKIREWKNWLAGEYGEQIEACAYHLEQNLVKQALYYIVLPGIILAVSGYFIPWWLTWLIVPCVTAVSICVLYNKISLLLRHRSIARMVRLWRSNDSGMDLPQPSKQLNNNSGRAV